MSFHFRPVWNSVFLVAFSLPWLTSALRAEGFQPVPQEELKMTSEPLAPGAAAIILYRQVDRADYSLDRGANGNWGGAANYQEVNLGNGHETDYYRIKVLTEEGRKYADIELPYNDETGSIVDIHARTIHPDGSIVNFDGKVVDKEVVKAKGLKIKAKTFAMPDVTVGSVLEYYYTTILAVANYNGYTAVRLRNSHWVLSEDLFTKKAVFSMLPFKGSEDTNDPTTHIRWNNFRLPQGAQPPKQGNDRVIRMEVSNVPAFQEEDYAPPENELKSRVDFTYSDDFETDPAKFWKDHGKKIYDSVEKFTGKSKAMQQAVGQIVSADDSPEVKLRKLYARVQQLRNTSYEFRKTEQEKERANQKPNFNVEDVWNRGYGDSTQLDWLFLALARAAGFEAYPVYGSERANYFFNPASMDLYSLDARFVLVKVEGKDVFCDPGAALAPFGTLPWYETGVQALRLDKDGGSWIGTPLPSSSSSRIVRRAELSLSDTGDLEGKLTVSFTGLEALERRKEQGHADDTARKKYLEDDVKSWIFSSAAQLDLTGQPDWKNSELPLTAEFKLKIPGSLSNAGKLALLPAAIFGASEKGVFQSEQRIHPMYFEYPAQKEDDVTITLPAGWQIQGVPAAQNVHAGPVLYSIKVENDKQVLNLHREFSSDLFYIPDLKLYPAVRGFFQAVRTGDEQQVVLLPGSTSAKN